MDVIPLKNCHVLHILFFFEILKHSILEKIRRMNVRNFSIYELDQIVTFVIYKKTGKNLFIGLSKTIPLNLLH